MNNFILLKTIHFLLKNNFLFYSGLTSLTTAHTLNIFYKDNKYIDLLDLYGSFIICYYLRNTHVLFNLSSIWFQTTFYKIINR